MQRFAKKHKLDKDMEIVFQEIDMLKQEVNYLRAQPPCQGACDQGCPLTKDLVQLAITCEEMFNTLKNLLHTEKNNTDGMIFKVNGFGDELDEIAAEVVALKKSTASTFEQVNSIFVTVGTHANKLGAMVDQGKKYLQKLQFIQRQMEEAMSTLKGDILMEGQAKNSNPVQWVSAQQTSRCTPADPADPAATPQIDPAADPAAASSSSTIHEAV